LEYPGIGDGDDKNWMCVMGTPWDGGGVEGPIRRPERGGGSEWDPIKILLKNLAYALNHFRRISHTLAKIT
jgi:hypothetical protein